MLEWHHVSSAPSPRARRVWVMDRGMVSEDNVMFVRSGGRRYILGTPKTQLHRFEREFLAEDWTSIREGSGREAVRVAGG